MARYFFDFYDGKMHRDGVGLECKGRDGVRSEAMQALPAIAKDRMASEADTQAYTILVRNEANRSVYTATLTFAGIWLGEDEPLINDED